MHEYNYIRPHSGLNYRPPAYQVTAGLGANAQTGQKAETGQYEKKYNQ